MKRFTVKYVSENYTINALNTNSFSKAIEREAQCKDKGYEAWVCDNLTEILVG